MKALLVDLHGTLLHLAEPVLDVYLRIGARHGQSPSREALGARLRAAMRTHDQALGKGYWRRVVHEAFASDDPALFEELFAAYAEPAAWRVDEEGVSVLRQAHRDGHPTAVVSNMDARAHALLDAFGLREDLDAVVLAEEHGVAKPDAALFREALRQLGASRAVHVGDHEVEDIAAAHALGLEAVLVRRPGAWSEAARRLTSR